MRDAGCFTWLYRLVIGAFFLYMLPGFSFALYKLLVQLWMQPALFWPLAGGFTVGIGIEAYFLSKLLEVGSFEHELTHSACALTLFRGIRQFRVFQGGGGYMEHGGGCGGLPGNDLISLAPYICPTLTVACVLARPLIPEQWFGYYCAAIGLTAGYHAMSTVTETADNWRDYRQQRSQANDFANAGPVFSAVVILPATLAVHGMLLAAILDWQNGIMNWADTSAEISSSIYVVVSGIITS